MSRRTILSRPRTKVYDANYDIGQSYYKSAIDRLDRKYSGRALTPPRQAPTLPQDILERHNRAFTDDDLPAARRRAEQLITEDNVFDVQSARRRPLSTAFEVEDDLDDEISSTLRQFRSKQRARKIINDVDLDSAVNNISYNRMIHRTDKMLDSVGLNEKSASRILDDDSATTARRRMIKFSTEEDSDNKDMTKWSALKDDESSTSAAAFRARQSRARLNDLENEMEAVSERQVARERRAANLRQIVAENAEDTQAMTSAMKSTSARISMRAEKKSVQF